MSSEVVEQGSRAVPLLVCGRYRLLDLLGQGGMGRVYKARDIVLERDVVLKFTSAPGAEAGERFDREARAQARIEHPNICRIFDTGTTPEGQHYIAMQFVDGMALSALAFSLNVREKVRVTATVARALHAAHSLGIIHRDVKPSNILIEQKPDGSLVPWLVDFGLARDSTLTNLTVSGLIVGTINYVSPEQALGQTHKIDRRTDVYALGVTLYEILAGAVPFSGESTVDALVGTMSHEPEPLHGRVAGISRDLETIVLKCLEKEQSRRYDSALELAEDLERYLADLPITARPPDLIQKLRRSARRHRRTATAVVCAALVGFVIAGLALNQKYRERQRSAIAAGFVDDVQYIERMLRHARTSSLGDIRPSIRAAEMRLERLTEAARAAGAVGRAPGDFARGSVLLSLGRIDQAAEALQAAWDGGYRNPSVAYALGIARGNLYEKRLAELSRLRDDEERMTRKTLLDRELREPTIALLEQARGVKAQSSSYLEALIAFYEGRDEKALSLAAETLREYPWLYEARVLAARIHFLRATGQHHRGSHEAVSAAYEKADAAFEAAVRQAASDPAVWGQRCELWRSRLQFELQSRSEDVQQHVTSALRACDAALTADPDSVDALVEKVRVLTLYASWQYRNGEDFAASSDDAVKTADRSVMIAPRNEWTHYARASAYFWRSTLPGLAPEERMLAADMGLASARRAVEIGPRFTDGHTFVGNLAVAKHSAMVVRGMDPRSALAEAIDAYASSASLDPRLVAPHNNLAHAYTHLGDYQRLIGVDPTDSYVSGAEAAARAAALSPSSAPPPLVAATAYRQLAEWQLRSGGDAEEALNRAWEWAQRASALSPNDGSAFFLSASIQTLRAVKLASEGRQTTLPLREARTLLEEGRKRTPNALDSWTTWAALQVVEAALGQHDDRGRDSLLQAPAQLAETVFARYPASAEAAALAAELLRSRRLLTRNAAHAEQLTAAERWYLQRAKSIDPLLTRYLVDGFRVHSPAR